MALTEKQKKWLWIGGIAAVVWLVVRPKVAVTAQAAIPSASLGQVDLGQASMSTVLTKNIGDAVHVHFSFTCSTKDSKNNPIAWDYQYEVWLQEVGTAQVVDHFKSAIFSSVNGTFDVGAVGVPMVLQCVTQPCVAPIPGHTYEANVQFTAMASTLDGKPDDTKPIVFGNKKSVDQVLASATAAVSASLTGDITLSQSGHQMAEQGSLYNLWGLI